MANSTNTPSRSDHDKASEHGRPSRPRPRRYVRHIDRSIANVLVRAAIKSGKIERLKAALRAGRFDA